MTIANEAPTPRSAREMELSGWLLQEGLKGTDRPTLLERYCERLVASGMPLLRVHMAQTAYHPKYGGIGFDWVRGAGVNHENYEAADTPTERWLKSPLYHLMKSGDDMMRVPIKDVEAAARFPMLEELRGMGGTDYYLRAVVMEEYDASVPIDPFNPPSGLLVSWTSNGAEGFSGDDIHCLRATLPHLAMALKSAANRRMAEDLLGVYLGADPGRRVLSGEIQRGSLERINAMICLFDLSGFTSMSERLPGAEMIALLNAYFGVAVEVIIGHGGHVLKFMGDGLLAMFDSGDAARDAAAALDMARELRSQMGGLNQARADEGLTTTDFTLALHAGEILYGNIGAEKRLDFTVIGPAVNMTARLSGMHRELGQPIVLSEAVRHAATVGQDDLVALGRYMLRGVAEPQALFTLYDRSSGAVAQG